MPPSRSYRMTPATGYKIVLRGLQNIARQVFVLRQFAEVTVDVSRVDTDRFAVLLACQIAGTEGHLLQQALEQGVQATGADVFGLLVDLPIDLGQTLDAVFGELDVQTLGLQQ